jgi:hypothetical protein
VAIYGLTAAPVARLLGVAGLGRRLVLIVGGHAWAREIGTALRDGGVAVRMWVGRSDQRTAARRAGLDADRGRIMLDAISREEELEEVTDALLLTPSDDVNTLAAAELRGELGHRHVFRLAPDPEEPDLLPPSREAGIFGNRSLTFAELDRQFASGVRIVTRDADDLLRAKGRPTEVPLFAVTDDGRLSIAADGRRPDMRGGDRVILLAGLGTSRSRPGTLDVRVRQSTHDA